MGPTSKNLKKKKKNKTKHLEAKQAERKRCREFYIFLKFLVFKSSFSDSRVSVRQNLSG